MEEAEGAAVNIISAAVPRVDIVGGGLFATVTPTLYVYEHGGERYRLLIPAGFLFDAGSIPRPFWTPLGVTPADMATEALPHDLFYHRQGRMEEGELLIRKNGEWVPCLQTVKRSTADEMLFALCKFCKGKASKYARPHLIWAAVRVGGFFAWQRDDEARKFKVVDSLMEA